MKIKFIVTGTAGRDVAGMPSPGEGEPVFLTESQAEHPLRLQHIRRPTDHDGDGKMGGSKPRAKAN